MIGRTRLMSPADIALTKLEADMHAMFRATGIERRILWAVLLRSIAVYRSELAFENQSWKRAQEQHLMRHGIGFLEARS